MNKTAGRISLILLALALAVTAVLSAFGAEQPVSENMAQSAQQLSFVSHDADITGQYPGSTLTDADRMVCENEDVALYYNQKDMVIKLQDQNNGYVWTTATEQGLDSLSNTWQEFSRALIVIETINSGTVKSKQRLPDFPAEGYATRYLDNGFTVDVTFSDVGLIIPVTFTLTDNGLTVSVVDEQIQSDPAEKNLLSRMYILPFFGAAYSDTAPGYLFIPDGSGALIRYEKPGVYTNRYQQRIYGKDYSVNASVSEDASNRQADYMGEMEPYSITLPVYGVAHGADQNAFLARICSGGEYCELIANPAGVQVDHYWVAPQFIYREIYWVSDEAGFGFNVMQSSPNTVDPQVTYSFLADSQANYVGMANAYKAQLVNEGVLPENDLSGDHIPLYLDALMGEAVESLLSYRVETMTTFSDVESWLSTLEAAQIENLVVSLRGIEPGGYSARSADSFRLNRKIGTQTELEELYGAVTGQGNILTIAKDYTKIYDVQAKTNDQVYSIERRYTTRALNAPLFDRLYFLNLSKAQSIVETLADQPDYYRSLSLDSTANLLYANFKSGSAYTRSQAVALTQSLLETAGANGQLYLENPNAYGFSYAAGMYSIPITHSQYLYESDCVPFLQILLSGKVPMFSESMNGSVSSDAVTLRLIEFNTYPAYTLTEQSANLLVDSNSRDIFGSKAELMLPLLTSQYQQVDRILSKTIGLSMLSRKIPTDGVVVITYEKDITVVVNYTDREYPYLDTVVAPRDAVVFQNGKAVTEDA